MARLIIWVHREAELIRQVKELVIESGLDSVIVNRRWLGGWYYGLRINGVYVNTSDNEGTYNRPEFDEYQKLDARTDMDKIQEALGLPPAKPRYTVRRCIVLTHKDPELNSLVREMAGEAWPLPWNSIFDSISSIACGEFPPYSFSGWMDDLPPVYFSQNQPYQDWPTFDARTQIEQLKEHWKFMPKKEDNKLNAIIVVHGDRLLSERVQRMAISAGYSWTSGHSQEPANTESLVLLFGEWFRGEDGPKRIRHTSDVIAAKNIKPGWLVFDARKDMTKVVEFFGFDPKKPLPIEQLVQPKLLEMIRSMPGDDMVAGFIRRDLGIALPLNIQEQGAQAICDWIMKEKAGHPPIPIKPDTNRKFKIGLEIAVYGHYNWTRTDTVFYEADVPQEVIDEAVNDDDYTPIQDWMVENRSILTEVSRREGEVRDGDSDTTDEEYDSVSDIDSLNIKFEQIMDEQ